MKRRLLRPSAATGRTDYPELGPTLRCAAEGEGPECVPEAKPWPAAATWGLLQELSHVAQSDREAVLISFLARMRKGRTGLLPHSACGRERAADFLRRYELDHCMTRPGLLTSLDPPKVPSAAAITAILKKTKIPAAQHKDIVTLTKGVKLAEATIEVRILHCSKDDGTGNDPLVFALLSTASGQRVIAVGEPQDCPAE